MKDLRVALIHDWLTGMRGGEQVLEAWIRMFPQAEVFTLIHKRGSVSPTIEARPIRTSLVDRFPAVRRWYRLCLPLFPHAIERFDVSGYDVIISTSHCVARGIRPVNGTPHLSYCLTPMRYVWDLFDDYFPRGSNPVLRAMAAALAPRLRRWDRSVTDRASRLVACSHHIAERVARAYGRKADAVVYPPVNVHRFHSAAKREAFYLTVSALVPYKRIDVAIRAFNRLGRRLIVVGEGSERARLERMAGPTIQMTGWVADSELAELLARCRGFVFCAEEDFGISPVEAQAAGAPVIAFARGGVNETVVAGGDGPSTGVFYDVQDPDVLATAIEQFESMSFDPKVIRTNVERFSVEHFEAKMRREVDEMLAPSTVT